MNFSQRLPDALWVLRAQSEALPVSFGDDEALASQTTEPALQAHKRLGLALQDSAAKQRIGQNLYLCIDDD